MHQKLNPQYYGKNPSTSFRDAIFAMIVIATLNRRNDAKIQNIASEREEMSRQFR